MNILFWHLTVKGKDETSRVSSDHLTIYIIKVDILSRMQFENTMNVSDFRAYVLTVFNMLEKTVRPQLLRIFNNEIKRFLDIKWIMDIWD